MARTQLRLDAVTGSLVAIEGAAAAAGVPAAGAAEHLEDVLGHFAGAIKRITGAPTFTEQAAGQFSHALTGSAGMKLAGDLDVNSSADIAGAVNMQATLAVAGKADFAGIVDVATTLSASEIKVDGDVAGYMYRVGPQGQLFDEQDLKFGPGLLQVTGSVDASSRLVARAEAILASAKVQDLTAGRLVYSDVGGELIDNANFAISGSDLVMASARVTDLTATRVVVVGTDGGLVDSAEMTFGPGGLTLAKDLSARSGSFSGDLTISGDLNVMGATTTIDTQNLLVKDAKIVISSGSLVDGAGLYLADDTAGENIRWATADGGKWIASDKFAADTMQALDLSSNIVWADASGNLVEISNQDLADAIEGRLAAGTGVTISEAGATITVAIGQPVATTDAVTFAVVTGSNLTASRLMASNGSKAMVSADLFAWVAGTANQVSVADDNDGSITLSLPQDIHSAATPEFAALNLGAYGDLLASGSDFKVQAAADLFLADAQGAFKLSEVAGDWTSFVANFGNVSLVEALNSLAGGAVAGKGKWVKALTGDVANGQYTFVGADKIGGSAVAPDLDAAADRTEIYLNGQLMVSGADYSVTNAMVDFEFGLKADDVIVAVIR